jgi:CubicO group peptidase (beta-lactamase class C family)
VLHLSSVRGEIDLPATRRAASGALRLHFSNLVARERIPKIAWGLIVDGEIVDGAELDVQSRICSMTKSFAAVALLQLRDAGAVDLDAPAAVYVPEIADWSHKVTVRQLLTMTAGLPSDDAWADRCLDWPRAKLDAVLCGVTLARDPGLRFEYANLGWAMLGRVITNASSSRAQEYITASVIEPLGLNRTTWTAAEPTMSGHRMKRDDVVPEPERRGDGEFASMGGLWSSAADICRWMTFLIGGDERVLSAASRYEMQTMHVVASMTDRTARGYGYGLFVEHDEKLGRVVEHPGGLPGYGSSMRWLPDRRVGVVALANLTYAPMSEATRAALDIVAPAERREVVTKLTLRLVSQLASWDVEVERELFSENVLIDADRDERMEAAAGLGSFTTGVVDALTPTHASVPLKTPNGDVQLEVWLTAESRPRIQRYELRR